MLNFDPLIEELAEHLADSRSVSRKEWAEQIVESGRSLEEFLPLLHFGDQTSQRFMWLLGDICELSPATLEPVMPLLFSFRNEMPFPGMDRSVAKWLWLTGVPESVFKPASKQLLDWIRSDTTSVACQAFAAKALVDLVKAQRIAVKRVADALTTQIDHKNPVHAKRMKNVLESLNSFNA